LPVHLKKPEEKATMNNNQTAADYSARIRAAWVGRDPSKDYWTLPQDVIALVIDKMVAELPEAVMLKMAALNGFSSVEDLVRSLNLSDAEDVEVCVNPIGF
jgi:hypothetical protein